MMTINASRRSGTKRATLAVGLLLGFAAVVTSAAITQWHSQSVLLDGSHNTFALKVAGSSDPMWLPDAEDFQDGLGGGYTVPLFDGDDIVADGHPLSVRVAVLNASPQAAGQVVMAISQKAIGSATQDFFDELRFSIAEGDTLIAQDLSGDELETVALPGALAAGEERVLTVTVAMLPHAEGRWHDVRTGIEVRFTGENL